MRVAFRVDAASHIGIGHYMRCLTLAEALAARGAEVHFFSRHITSHLRNVLSSRGYFLTELSRPGSRIDDAPPHAAWLGTSQAADAEEFIDRAPCAFDWLVVDHYSLDARWESPARARTSAMLVIDDVADRHHDCDVLLDQNLYRDAGTRYQFRLNGGTRKLLGPGYALLRPEFAELRRTTPPRDGTVSNVLVTLGGTDARNLTLGSIHALGSIGIKSRRVDVVIGAAHGARSEVEEQCRARGFRCHVQPQGMARLMAEADLAIGAAGSTSWERCCLGVPTICITDGSNQVAIAEGLEAAGAVVNLGDGSALHESDLARVIEELLSNPSRLGSLSRAAYSLVDGRGVERVCATMEAA